MTTIHILIINTVKKLIDSILLQIKELIEFNLIVLEKVLHVIDSLNLLMLLRKILD